MKIPTTLKIAGLTWKVKESKNIATEGSCWGSTHYDSQTIYLDPATTEQHKAEVLLHEILHAVMWVSRLDQRFRSDNKPTDEEVVCAVTATLFQVLKDNKLRFE